MSDQDMQFADPDWQPVSAPPREGTQSYAHSPAYKDEEEEDSGDAAYSSYEEGYRASDKSRDNTFQASAMRGQPRRKKRGALFWTLLAIIICIIISLPFDAESGLSLDIFPALLILGLIFLIGTFVVRLRQGLHSTSITETHAFSVAAHPKIIIKNDMGAIRVHSGSEEAQVVVQAQKRSAGLFAGPSSATVQYDQNSDKNRINVKAKTGWHFLGKTSVDLDILVPRLADLDLKTEAGSVTVSGVNGQMTCASEAGSVRATDVMLLGDSKLKTDAGSVTFAGSLNPIGSYLMTTDAGSVNVTLPRLASFKLDAKTDVGSINSDFPAIIQQNFPGAKARGDLGAGPHPTLKLRTDVGSINIRQGD